MRIEDLLYCSSDADPENMSLDQLLTRCPPAEMPRKAPFLLMQFTYGLGNDKQPRPTQIPRESISATKRPDDARHDFPRSLSDHKPQGHPTPQVTYLATVN
ncbi:hypothetical protein EV122DRAFT_293097 [Schizophyllum commune]